ncbi:MAG: PASTA domain-containing protein [Clostridia bacterium]|nr:PASTA domain-containing protein [Clostridia bacterium]
MSKGTTVRMRRRSLIVLGFLVFFGFPVLALRLITLQLFQGDFLQQMASEQQLADTKTSAMRGSIYDRNMKPLAQSATVWNVVLEPAYINSEEKKEIICTGLSEILDIPLEKLRELSKKNSCYTVIKRKIDSTTKNKIIEFKNNHKISNGIRLIEDFKRFYPYGKFAAPLIGFTGADSQGLSGIEAYYEKILKGEPGRIVTARNAIGTEMPFDYEQIMPSKPGQNLKLSIDETIQRIMEKTVEEGIINNQVKNRGAAIAMDVKTGEILGMAVKGDFDPNEPFKIADPEEEARIEKLPEEQKAKEKSEALSKQWRNKAVSDTYYPGSVFKMVTASMGLELDVVNEQSTFTCNGSIQPVKGAQTISCHETRGHGTQNFVESLCHSCNPAFIMLGQRIGVENFFNFYKLFGFHNKTDIDLPGESNDIFFNKDGKMNLTDLAVASIGQNFGITPIQMITAAATIANGGNLVQPHVVKEILDENGNIVKTIDPVIKRKVISEKTSRRVIDMLHKNATDGAARNAYIPGYRVAGKTGTAEKIGLSEPGQKDYISSFCGFAPADDPKIVMLVFFDTPKGKNYYGSAVAAPVFTKAMQDILPYMGIEKIYTEQEREKLGNKTPNTIGKSIGEAKNMAVKAELKPVVIGSGETVLSQIPSPSEQVVQGGTIVLYTDNESKSKTVKVPKLTGLSLFEVNKTSHAANLNVKLSGQNLTESNVLSSTQSIPEGTEVPPGTSITVGFIHKDRIT